MTGVTPKVAARREAHEAARRPHFRLTSERIVLSPPEHVVLNAMLESPPAPNDALVKLMRGTTPWDAPNRLHGAYVNDDGDAA